MKKLDDYTNHKSIKELLVSFLRRKSCAFLCGFIVCCSVWFALGKSMEVWGKIVDPEWWMLYGAVIFKIASGLADKTYSLVYKECYDNPEN